MSPSWSWRFRGMGVSRDCELEILADFGKRLRSLRNLFGFTKEEFSDIIGIESCRLDDFEEGRCQPKFRILRRISDFTTCDIDILITGNSFGVDDDNIPVSKEWEVLFGKLIAGDQTLTSAWYWESDDKHRLTLTCKPPLGPHTSSGIIGHTRWEYVGANVQSDEHWARHYETLESRNPIHNFVFRGNSGFVKVWGKPAYGPNGEFVGYRGYAGPATMEEAMSEWRAHLTSVAS